MSKLNNIHTLSDAELVDLYKKEQDTRIIGELYKRYTQFVFYVCLKYMKNEEDAKEAAMQIFERLISSLLKHEVDNFKPWLHTVAKNHCLITLRNRKPQLRYEQELKKDIIGVMETGDNSYLDIEIEKEAKLTLLQKAILELKNGQKKCIELFYLEEKCYTEVAQITGYTMNEVKSFIQNGKRNLKIYMLERDE